MCRRRLKIDSSNRLSPKSVFCTCGKCEECRKVLKKSWGFRLQAEIQDAISKHWQVCFFTLTYNDESLPRLGSSVFTDDYQNYIRNLDVFDKKNFPILDQFAKWCELPCFSRDDIQQFVHAVREWLWRTYDVKQLVYFGAGEFGSHTQRPHYHFLVAVPPNVDCWYLHSFIVEWWYLGSEKEHRPSRGFVFPKLYSGGVDSSGYRHKSFVVDSPMAAARYAAKYATKDLYYSEFLYRSGLSDCELDLKSRAFKRKMVFHVQKRGLGSCILDGKTDDEKLNMLKFGFSFFGDEEPTKIPVYIKNKIVFDNYYIFEKCQDGLTGSRELGYIPLAEDYSYRRLCRRKANRFFKDNAKEIFELKLFSYSSLFDELADKQLYLSRGIRDDLSSCASDYMRLLLDKYGARMLARIYLLYDGVPLSNRYYCDCGDDWKLYLARYIPDYDLSEFSRVKPEGFPDDVYILDVLGMILSIYYLNPLQKSQAQRIADLCKDYHGHME